MKEDRETKQVKSKRGGAVKKAPEGYYTAKEAQNKLGMNASTFGYYVRGGKIKRFVPPLRVEGFYEKREIDRLASEVALFLHTAVEASEKTEVRAARTEDAQGIVNVLTRLGWKTTSVEQRISWYAVNPLVDYVVLWGGEVMGYIHAIPLKPIVLEAMMSGKKRSWDVQPQDVLSYEPGKTYDLYIGIATRQDIPNSKRFSFRLISGFLSLIEDLAQQKIFFHHIYAVSAENDGQKLSKAIGFIEQEAKENDLFPRFMLDLKKSDSHFAKQYRGAVKRIQEGNITLQG